MPARGRVNRPQDPGPGQDGPGPQPARGRALDGARPGDDEAPLRAALFSTEQMEQHGARLAAAHQWQPGRTSDQLLVRLADNERALVEARAQLIEAIGADQRISPAGEWLLDNFYLIEEQIRIARRHLPRGYSRQLPALTEGASAGLPRVYDIALETIAHGDGQLDTADLGRFVSAYQTVAPLRLGELWAIPIMLRLALIENLRRVSERIVSGRQDRAVAIQWADRLTETVRRDPKALILEIADMARSDPPLTSPFVSELARRLQGQGPALALPLTWIEQQLAESGRSIEHLVRAGNQRQAADQVSVANSIGSLRHLDAADWRAYVEEMSLVEITLRADPAGAHERMDFNTRDRYRHVIEGLARASGLAEAEVAAHALELARRGAGHDGPTDRRAHVGYYLIDRGRPQLERSIRARRSGPRWWRADTGRLPLWAYLGPTVLLTLVITAALVERAWSDGIVAWMLLPVGLLALTVSSQLAIALVNWVASQRIAPQLLPRMDFSGGIPPASSALVVVPTMLTSEQGVERLVEALEVRFLANRDDSLYFGLLTDFADAGVEVREQDERLLSRAREGVEELNARHADPGPDRFYLFHRPRSWNPRDQVWMGRERKRGKLADLNGLLQKGEREPFSLIVGRTEALAAVKYVITLDTDTELPRGVARELVGAMEHPLHRPVFDLQRRRVQEGHGILQPRVSASLPGTTRSRYARMNSGEAGIDPYTRAVSDVYQDAFGEGSFIGKGIYDLEAFEAVLAGRFPDNRILSHDLIEGCLARSGLVSDVQVYEDHPARYAADVERRHRWIRGDWQLLAWTLPRVSGPDGRRRPNPLSMLSRWKLLDNLRRSLVPAALTLMLVFGWLGSPAPGFWTLAVLGLLLVPPLLASLVGAARRPGDTSQRRHLAAAARGTGARMAQLGLTVVTLPHEAYFSLDAILRTLWRLGVSRRHLLDWQASGEDPRRDRDDPWVSVRQMAFAPALAVVMAAVLAVTDPGALAVASPVLAAWAASPAITWWLGRPKRSGVSRLTADQTRFLGGIARRTWAFFETHLGPDDHWLPPDNVQESRADPVAHRTSPTNMGLALLANLSALDFGYISSGELVERTARTLETMAGLERHRGHFYNWYDTHSLRILPPAYVSTVDSGNLAGHLLTLRAGLLELADRPVPEPRLLEGLLDTLTVLEESAGAAFSLSVAGLRQEIGAALDRPSTSLHTRWQNLQRWARTARSLVEQSEQDESRFWARALERQCRTVSDDLLHLAPWIETSAHADAAVAEVAFTGELTLRRLAEGNAGLSDTDPSTARGQERARERVARLHELAAQAGDLARMDQGFLFRRRPRLFTVGYHVDERQRDAGSYDLLASEARLGIFVAIAQGEVSQESWFALGRLLTTAGGEPVLVSWSGSIFEYLMPQLVMPTYPNTLLDQTARAAVRRQIEYGRQRDVPWGISESGYHSVDASLNYQYRAFGVPGLGMKRGLGEDLVVAPYASALALMVAPQEACENLQRLWDLRAWGRFGFHEAIDYTPARQRPGQTHAVVRSYMVHHQGMSLLALEHQLLDRPMQRRFCSDPMLQGALLLLQERIPRTSATRIPVLEEGGSRGDGAGLPLPIRVIVDPDTPTPEVQLLSNGRYHVMVTHAGGGYTRWGDLAVTRWREDGTRDRWGSFCYLRDEASGAIWSAAHQPVLRRAAHYEAIFSAGRAEFRRRDRGDDFDFDTHTEIVVSPEDDVELRRVRITNRSPVRRWVQVTTYAEVVLAPPTADELHPAFSNLFVQTEIVEGRRAVLCTRRPRSREEHSPWAFHLVGVHDARATDFSCETDRGRFLGRGRGAADPEAMDTGAPLSGSQGSVLDPVVAIRCRIELDPRRTAIVDLVTGVADTRESALELVGRHQDRRLADRVFELSWTHAQVVMRQINATEADAQLYGRLAGAVLHAAAPLRADSGVLSRNQRGQSGLWGYAISGDLPIVLLRIGDLEKIELVRQLIQAHAFWRLKGLAVDLVIWNEDRAGYRQALQERILGLVAVGIDAQAMERPGGIFLRSAEQISDEDRTLFQSVARVVLSDDRGSLAEQVDRVDPVVARPPLLTPGRTIAEPAPVRAPQLQRQLILSNGIGGFTADGREYVITTTPGQRTPAPWVNVLANQGFGTVISESGQAYTWAENAHSFRLSPWHNDPVSDSGGEAFYLRDEESGRFWSPTPLPRRGSTPYVSRHGFGYSVFEHSEHGIESELWVYVAPDAPTKFSLLKIRNLSGRRRRISATGYVEWVLGDLRSTAAMHISTRIDPDSGAVLASNPYNTEFSGRIAFFDVDDEGRSITCDRTEFLGRNGSPADPAAMHRTHLSGSVGFALDPCAAIQTKIELHPGEQREIIFRLGVMGPPAEDHADLASSGFVRRLRGAEVARRALEAAWEQWNRVLGAVQVHTPDESLNVLTNGWLIYQTLACRMWARSGYYQSGGAFGFRDQLQDAMALVHTEPGLLREQLLRCAARQFVEGDVQHWWHPPSGRGVRTHCSDDYLWLPLAAGRYVSVTGDSGVLDEMVPFLEGRPLRPEDESSYDLPAVSSAAASFYEHCVRAIRHGFRHGEHGLPLIGSGDWNDGMNRVGAGGRGESVWLAFFLCAVLRDFEPLAHLRGDADFAGLCAGEGVRLRASIEEHGWDGSWYRRAYFDDGTPLGSTQNTDCRIDSIAQSWSVLSGAGDPQRARRAMDAVDEHLVCREDGLVQLLDPPFDLSLVDPGYIKGYVPGVRENGGQYTHAAVWAAMAFASLGDHRRAWELTTMINPANHAASPEAIATYKVEPYVVAADVYAVPPHTGRGGWTWYTGSAAWMYRLIVESLLGLRREVDRLHIVPCLPTHWERCEVFYRHRDTVHRIEVVQVHRAAGDGDVEIRVTMDGIEQEGTTIQLRDDQQEHRVHVRVLTG